MTAQHMMALDYANETRIARCALKRRVRAGEVTVMSVLTNPPHEALTMSLLSLLQAQHRWGRARALRVTRMVGVSESRRLNEMTVRQRVELADFLAGRTDCPRWWHD